MESVSDFGLLVVPGPSRASMIWRAFQILFFCLGVALLVLLGTQAELGLNLFWNLWIPLAPALLLLIPGFWRNVCPLASGSVLLRRLGLNLGLRVGRRTMVAFRAIGVLTLLIIVPLRHPLFDQDASLTLLLFALLIFFALTLGMVFEWKAGWCAGVCPIHPVERLYGTRTLFRFSNMQCKQCEGCVPRCPDSIPNDRPFRGKKSSFFQHLDAVFFPGFFPGFIWGWFHVPNLHGLVEWEDLLSAYYFPLLGGLVTLVFFLLLVSLAHPKKRGILRLLFAGLAIGCYYWYRIPALFGMGPFPGDGMLIDLRESLPTWFETTSHIGVFILILLWFVRGIRMKSPSWLHRPRISSSLR
jgi:hypothetical protein